MPLRDLIILMSCEKKITEVASTAKSTKKQGYLPVPYIRFQNSCFY